MNILYNKGFKHLYYIYIIYLYINKLYIYIKNQNVFIVYIEYLYNNNNFSFKIVPFVLPSIFLTF
jgi:hypothetical protein